MIELGNQIQLIRGRRDDSAIATTLPQQSKQRLPGGGLWTHPVIANGRLYVRDQELLFCFDVKK